MVDLFGDPSQQPWRNSPRILARLEGGELGNLGEVNKQPNTLSPFDRTRWSSSRVVAPFDSANNIGLCIRARPYHIESTRPVDWGPTLEDLELGPDGLVVILSGAYNAEDRELEVQEA